MTQSHTVPFVVAEVAQGYEGSPRSIDLLCNAVIATSADAIKFQIFYADELATSDYQYYSLFKSLEVSFDVWADAVKKIHGAGKQFYSDIFGLKSLSALNEIGVDGFKVHSTDINNFKLLEKIASTGKNVLLSTGGCESDEVGAALNVLDKKRTTLLHGFQAEPTEPEDNHIFRMRAIRETFGCPVGFQDHTAGDSPLSILMPSAALGVGATLIEKHITLSRLSLMEDCVSALTPEEFKPWCDQIKALSSCLGSDKWVLNEKEKFYRAKVKRALCASRNLSAGTVLSAEDFTLKRSGNSKAVYDSQKLLGKTLKSAVTENQALEESFFS